MAKVEVEMPKMGESITEGTVITWHKQPGDTIEPDETILEIGTDKVDTEVPSPAGGVLAEMLVEEGETVEVGTPIAVIETEPEAAGAEESEQEETEEETPTPSDEEGVEDVETRHAASPTASQKEAPSGGEEVEVVMPKMGESITEGTLITWHKQPGDEVEADETIVEIGTDKVDTEVPSPAAGFLKEQLVEEGETVEVGTPIAILTSEEAAVESTPAPAEPEEDVETRHGASQEEPAPATGERGERERPSGDGAVRRVPVPAGEGGEIQRHGEDGRFYSPLVRSIAEEEGLSMQELEQIDGSGREGRVTKEDVLGYLEAREEEAALAAPQRVTEAPARPQPIPAGEVDDYDGRVEIVEMDRMRQITAEHMIRSKATSAHVTSFAETDVTNLVKFRENNKGAFQEREGIKLTFTPFFVQAAVEALKEHPVVNASVEGDRIILKKDYHVGIAVAIGKKGLMAPVIRHAERQNLTGLAHAAADLAERTRSKRLQPDELQGGTFTVTNIGSLGSIMGTPIINQPQVGILATGAIKKRPVVVEDEDLGDIIAIRHIMYACLSYDHRIIDGAMGASFLQHFCRALESFDPEEEL